MPPVSGHIDNYNAKLVIVVVVMKKHVALLAYDGCMSSGVAAPLDVFAIANAQTAVAGVELPRRQYEWSVVSLDGKPLRCSNGLLINADGGPGMLERADIVVMPGLDHTHLQELVEGAQALAPRLQPLLEALLMRGALIATQGSASFLLAETGLLDGKVATTSWWLSPAFQRRFPRVKLTARELVTRHDTIYCAGAVSAYMHLCVKLIERFSGRQIAHRTAKVLLLQTQGVSQAPFMPLSVVASLGDSAVAQAVDWLAAHMAEDFVLDDLLQTLSISKRTLMRRFQKSLGVSPSQYLQRLRIDKARWLLESTGLSTELIAEQVGYRDPSSLRRLFAREIDMSMADYRQRFRIHSV